MYFYGIACVDKNLQIEVFMFVLRGSLPLLAALFAFLLDVAQDSICSTKDKTVADTFNLPLCFR